uniref:Uncharacterized protein n=1 Tax=Arundo donax TaxID=35708 RepID=A0A0A8Y5L8_ARUDO
MVWLRKMVLPSTMTDLEFQSCQGRVTEDHASVPAASQ